MKTIYTELRGLNHVGWYVLLLLEFNCCLCILLLLHHRKQATSEHSRTQKAARITKTVPRRNRNPLKRYLPLVDANKLHQSVVDGGLVEEEWEGKGVK